MIYYSAHRQNGHNFKARLLHLQPKLYFELNEASGSTLTNRGTLGTGFNATITGTPTYQAASMAGDNNYSMTFSGSTNYAATSTSSSIGNSLGVHTMGCWAKWTSTTTTLGVLSLRDGTSGANNTAPLIILANHPTAGKITAWSAGNNSVSTSGSSYNDGNRHFIAAGIDNGGNVILWVDGSNIGSGSRGSLTSVSVGFGIGANVASTPLQFFPGTIDEAFLIPALNVSDAMVLALYNAGIR